MQKVQLTKETVETLYNSKQSYQEIATALGLPFAEDDIKDSVKKIKDLFNYFNFEPKKRSVLKKEADSWFEIIENSESALVETFEDDSIFA